MNPLVSIVMGSASDLPVMEEAFKLLEQLHVPFEVKIMSAHRTPEMVEQYISSLRDRGVKVVIAGAGGAAHLPGVVAAFTTLPVIGVPINSSISIDGWDSILSILQMPPGIPVATVGLNAARNAAILAVQIISVVDKKYSDVLNSFRSQMKDKVIKSNEKIKGLDYKYLVK